MINGRRVDYGVDGDASRKATQAAQDRTMKLAEQMQGLDAGALDIAKKRMENSAMQSTGGGKAAYRGAREIGRFRHDAQTMLTQSSGTLAAEEMCSQDLSSGLQKLCRLWVTRSAR
jgi:hypothetical protein